MGSVSPSTSNPTSPPLTQIRSTKGCWTCRLRKKKCDETRSPGCLRCQSMDLVCYYGVKPDFIKDPVLGKEELERVKAQVAVCASQKRAAFRKRAREDAASASQIPRSEGGTGMAMAIEARDTPGSLVSPTLSVAPPTLIPEQTILFSHGIGDQEARLIMHYFDHVFYIQFRFHTPTLSAGGRGWLLSLLTRTKPLYHAALSLSAFHQQSLMAFARGEEETDYLQELERQHNLTLQELQLSIQAHSLDQSETGAFDRNVQILACTVQLISFELFNGGVSNWQVHLRAASDIVLVLYDIPPQDKLPSRDRNSRRRSSSSPESVGLKFFAGCIIWFDTLSCISTGRRPYLGDFHDRLLSSPLSLLGADIDLQSIAGCYNWVMIIIAEIATLISESTASGELPSAKTADVISDRLDLEQSPLRKELEAIIEVHGGWPPHSSPDLYNRYTILAVTNVFASAARIYLCTATKPSHLSPFQIRPALDLTIEAFRMIPDPRMVRAMVWALCVAGCMASSLEDQKFFQDAATGAITEARSFGNSGKALEILEMSWRLQLERGYLVDCASTIRELGTCILLV